MIGRLQSAWWIGHSTDQRSTAASLSRRWWLRRLVPGSLFGRLVLILLIGVVGSQSIVFLVLSARFDAVMADHWSHQLADRVAFAVDELAAATPTDRAALLQRLSEPGFELALNPPVEEADVSPTMVASAAQLRTRQEFAALVATKLAFATEVRVTARLLDEDQIRQSRSDWWRRWRGPVLELSLRVPDGSSVRLRTDRVPPTMIGGHSLLDRFRRLMPGPPPMANPSRRWFRQPPSAPIGAMLLDAGLRLIGLIGVAVVVTRLTVKPLAVVAQAAESLGRDIRGTPMLESGPDEVRRVARAFNQMQQRLVQVIDGRTRVLAAVSHDLRTPLTRLRLRLELQPESGARSKSIQDVGEMQQMVEQILDFLKSGQDREPLELTDMTALIESLRVDHDGWARRVTIRGRGQNIAVRQLAIKRCLANLIDNAIRYGEKALVLIEDSPQALCVRVLDEGPGIDTQHMARVFEPFYRIEDSRNRDTGGTGLGLSIARDITLLHHGSLHLSNRPEGGMQASLLLPRL